MQTPLASPQEPPSSGKLPHTPPHDHPDKPAGDERSLIVREKGMGLGGLAESGARPAERGEKGVGGCRRRKIVENRRTLNANFGRSSKEGDEMGRR